MDAMGKFVAQGFKDGTLKDTAGLKPTKDGFRIRSSKGKLTTTDGPFVETKEVVGGYAMIEVETEKQAREIAHAVHGAAPSALARLRMRVRGTAAGRAVVGRGIRQRYSTA